LLSVCQAELDRVVTDRAVVGELAVAHPSRVQAAAVNGAGASVAGAGVQVLTGRVLAVLAERDHPVRCQEVVAALGEDPPWPGMWNRCGTGSRSWQRPGGLSRWRRACSPCRVHEVRRRGERLGDVLPWKGLRRVGDGDKACTSFEEDPMEPYPDPGSVAAIRADDFAASRAQLEQMIAHLGGADMMNCSQQMLEEYVTETFGLISVFVRRALPVPQAARQVTGPGGSLVGR
jgi:hypothetical protein